MLQQQQLPDGSWFNTSTGVVEAPLNPVMGGGQHKRQPSPAGGVYAPPLQAEAPAAEVQALDGFVPGPLQLQARPGRNYPALGALEGMSEGMKKVVAVAAIVGVAALTVWLQKRKKKSKK